MLKGENMAEAIKFINVIIIFLSLFHVAMSGEQFFKLKLNPYLMFIFIFLFSFFILLQMVIFPLCPVCKILSVKHFRVNFLLYRSVFLVCQVSTILNVVVFMKCSHKYFFEKTHLGWPGGIGLRPGSVLLFEVSDSILISLWCQFRWVNLSSLKKKVSF
jgi:hypothetical protein